MKQPPALFSTKALAEQEKVLLLFPRGSCRLHQKRRRQSASRRPDSTRPPQTSRPAAFRLLSRAARLLPRLCLLLPHFADSCPANLRGLTTTQMPPPGLVTLTRVSNVERGNEANDDYDAVDARSGSRGIPFGQK